MDPSGRLRLALRTSKSLPPNSGHLRQGDAEGKLFAASRQLSVLP